MGPDFIQLSGDDMTALACMAAGAHGCISVVSNIAPRLCADLQNACLAGDFAKALAIQDKLVPLAGRDLSRGRRHRREMRSCAAGQVSEEVRLPLVSVTEPTRNAIRAAMVHAGVLGA